MKPIKDKPENWSDWVNVIMALIAGVATIAFCVRFYWLLFHWTWMTETQANLELVTVGLFMLISREAMNDFREQVEEKPAHTTPAQTPPGSARNDYSGKVQG